MKYTIRKLKTMARAALRGKFPIAIGALLFVFLLSLISGNLPGLLFSGDSSAALCMNWLFGFILSLVLCTISAGVDFLYLNIARNKPCSFSDLFYIFQQQPDRAIVAGLALILLENIAMIPIYFSSTLMEDILAGSTNAIFLLFGLLFLSLALTFLLTLPFAFTYFLLADHPEMSAGSALKESLRLTRKNLSRLFFLQCSFIGLMLLSIFTLYIALLWVVPYMKTSITFLYLECRGEIAPANPARTQPSPSFYSAFSTPEHPDSEDHSEA